ncbi:MULTISPECIES: hypothetical protein [unclassified Variovorax]|uniref:hypothetical protein n=1 Tax=unclassified Variovorax TaxID=663243 RepID=UPI003F490ED8
MPAKFKCRKVESRGMVTPTASITVTMREADRLKTIQAVCGRMVRLGQTAQRLGISRR